MRDLLLVFQKNLFPPKKSKMLLEKGLMAEEEGASCWKQHVDYSIWFAQQISEKMGIAQG